MDAAAMVAQLKVDITDLSNRLYYCSNNGEGRKMRKWLKNAIRIKERQIRALSK